MRSSSLECLVLVHFFLHVGTINCTPLFYVCLFPLQATGAVGFCLK